MKNDETNNHYLYLDKHGPEFSQKLGLRENIANFSTAHGDKAYGYRREFEAEGIPFAKGVLVYLLSYISPWSATVRETDNGWVDTLPWVINLCKNNEAVKAALEGLPNYFTVEN